MRVSAVSAVSKVRYSTTVGVAYRAVNSGGKSEVCLSFIAFIAFIFKGNQHLGSFNDAYSATGTKTSIIVNAGGL